MSFFVVLFFRRLVDKLENMKKNALGNGASQCVLCGDEFGLLGASPLSCNDCLKVRQWSKEDYYIHILYMT